MISVLIVEDDEGVLSVLLRLLKGEGIDAIGARSGEEALEIARNRPDLSVAVVDRVLPGALYGDSLDMALRAVCPQIAFVHMSGYPKQPTRPQMNQSVEPLMLTKPVRRADLIDSISQSIQSHSILRAKQEMCA